MNKTHSKKKQALTNNWNRREFISGCAVCAAGITILPSFGISGLRDPILFAPGNDKKAQVKLIFAHPSPEGPIWPNIGYDFEGRISEIKNTLNQKCPGIEFHPVVAMNGSTEKANEILNTGQEFDGYIVYLVGCLWGDLTETIAASGKPTIIIDDLFAGSGEFLTSYASVKKQGYKVTGVSSSNFNDVVEAVNCFDCLKKLKDSTVLVVGSKADDKFREVFGTKMKDISFEEMNEAYKKVKPEMATKVAGKWISEAEKVIEPSREEIEKAATIYLAMKDLMQQYSAHAITINCLGGIYSGRLVEAYPCLGFMQLDNDGYVGACEADQYSTLTKLIMTYLIGRPGFISDPVIDTSKNRIIYAHCIASTKVYGPEGPSNPYHIRDHSEDRKGACNRSIMPLGEMTTTIKFDPHKKQVIFHQGKTVENVDEDKACRTKLAVEVKGDINKLFNYWDEWGWHRVTFFGDHKQSVYHIASLLGFEVIEEA